MRHIRGSTGKLFGDFAMLIWGYLAGEPTMGKGKDQGGLGGTGVVK